MNIFSKLLCRILPVEWEQPILESNGTVGEDEMAVKEKWTVGTYRPYTAGRTKDGKTAWYAFHTTSGYTSPYATGFGDDNERRGWYYLFIYSKKPISVTGISFCFPGLDSDNSSGGAFRYFNVKASNDSECWTDDSHDSWVELYSEDAGSNKNVCARGGSTTKSFLNSNYYNYHMLCCGTQGGGHKDGLTICSVRLNAVYEDFI